MRRPIGVILLAGAAALAGLYQLYLMLVYLGWVDFNVVGRSVTFPDEQWGAAFWSLLIALIWFWVAAGFWNLRAYALQFGIFISLFTMIFGFFSTLASNTTTEFEMIGWLLSIAIFFYLLTFFYWLVHRSYELDGEFSVGSNEMPCTRSVEATVYTGW